MATKDKKYNVQSMGNFNVRGISYHGPVNGLILSEQEVKVLKAIGFIVVDVNKTIAKVRGVELSAEDKAKKEADGKAKKEADAKAEAKAKKEAEDKVEAEAKKEAEDKLEAEAKAKKEAEDKLEAEAKAKKEAEDKAEADGKKEEPTKKSGGKKSKNK